MNTQQINGFFEMASDYNVYQIHKNDRIIYADRNRVSWEIDEIKPQAHYGLIGPIAIPEVLHEDYVTIRRIDRAHPYIRIDEFTGQWVDIRDGQPAVPEFLPDIQVLGQIRYQRSNKLQASVAGDTIEADGYIVMPNESPVIDDQPLAYHLWVYFHNRQTAPGFMGL